MAVSIRGLSSSVRGRFRSEITAERKKLCRKTLSSPQLDIQKSAFSVYGLKGNFDVLERKRRKRKTDIVKVDL